MPLFRALAKNMAPMTNADESPTNRQRFGFWKNQRIALRFFLSTCLSLVRSIRMCDSSEVSLVPLISTRS